MQMRRIHENWSHVEWPSLEKSLFRWLGNNDIYSYFTTSVQVLTVERRKRYFYIKCDMPIQIAHISRKGKCIGIFMFQILKIHVSKIVCFKLLRIESMTFKLLSFLSFNCIGVFPSSVCIFLSSNDNDLELYYAYGKSVTQRLIQMLSHSIDVLLIVITVSFFTKPNDN